MSCPRAGGGPHSLSASQRDASPPPSLRLCASQPIPSTPRRFFGSEITNRIPTPSPPQSTSPLPAIAETLCVFDIDATLPQAPFAPSSFLFLPEENIFALHSQRDDNVSYIPSYETLLCAISDARSRQGAPSFEGTHSISVKSVEDDPRDLAHIQTLGVDDQPGPGLIDTAAIPKAKLSLPPESNARRRPRDCVTESKACGTGFDSSWLQIKKERGERERVLRSTGTPTVTVPSPWCSTPLPLHTGVGASGARSSTGVTNNADADPYLASFSEKDAGDRATQRGVGGCPTPVPRKIPLLLPAGLAPPPQSRHVRKRECRPARLLDREHAAPTWQILTSVQSAAEKNGERSVHLDSRASNALLFTAGRGEMFIRSAVDDAIIYSPETLDVISPMMSRSKGQFEGALNNVAVCTRHSLPRVNDEEQRSRERSFAGAPCASPQQVCVQAIVKGDTVVNRAYRTSPHISTRGGATDSSCFVHEEVLQILAATSDDALET